MTVWDHGTYEAGLIAEITTFNADLFPAFELGETL